MKLSVDNGDYGLLFDANDDAIVIPISADTHTGECICAVMDKNGRPTIDHDKGEMVREYRRYLAPLRFDPANGKSIPSNYGLTVKASIPLEVRRI